MRLKKFTYASLLAMVLIVCMFGFTACGKKLDSIILDTANVKTVVEWNEDLDLTNLVVKAVYDEGKVTTTLKSNEYKISLGNFDKTVANTYTITVTFKEKSATFEVIVKERPAPVATAITIDTANVKKAYEWGEAFDATNLVVTKTMDYGNPQVATNEEIEVDSSLFNAEVAGTYTIVVKLKNTNYSQSFEVTVKERPAPVILGIEIDTTNVKKSFNWGEAFNANNLVVIIVKNYGENVTATSDLYEVISTNFNSQVAGTYTITVLLSGTNYSKTYTVTVSEPQVLSIELNTENVKKVFDYNDNFTSENLVVTKVTEAGNVVASENEINIDYSAFNGTVAGNYNIVVNLNGTTFSQSYSVTVNPLTISGIKVNTENLQTSFYLGQPVEFGENLQIYYTYQGVNNEDSVCTDAYSVDVSAVNAKVAGNYNVVVSIDGTELSTTFVVTILSETASFDMQIENMKTQFEWGEGFSIGENFSAKLLNYDGTETALPIDNIQINDGEFDCMREGIYTIVVSYGEYEKEYTVTVAPITNEQLYAYFAFENIQITTQTGKVFTIPYKNGETFYRLNTFENTKFTVNVFSASNYGHVEYDVDTVENLVVLNGVISVSFRVTNGNVSAFYCVSIANNSPLESVAISNGIISEFNAENITYKAFINEIENPAQINVAFNSEGYSWQFNGNEVSSNTYSAELVAGQNYTISIISNLYGTSFVIQTITIKVEQARVDYFSNAVVNYIANGKDCNEPLNATVTGDYDYVVNIYELPTSVEISIVFNEEYANYTFVAQKVNEDAFYIGNNEYIITVKNAENAPVAQFTANIVVHYGDFVNLLSALGECVEIDNGFYVTTKIKNYENNSIQNIEFYNANNGKITSFMPGENVLIASYTVDGVVFKANCIVNYVPNAVQSITLNNDIIEITEKYQNITYTCNLNTAITLNFEMQEGYRIFVNYNTTNPITLPYTFTYLGDYETGNFTFEICKNSSTEVVQVIYLNIVEPTLVKSIKVASNNEEATAVRDNGGEFSLYFGKVITSINVEVEQGYTYGIYVADEQLANTNLHLGENNLNIRIFDAQNNEVENKKFVLSLDVSLSGKDAENSNYAQYSIDRISGNIEFTNLTASKFAIEFGDANAVAKINGQVANLSNIEITQDLTMVEVSFGSNEYPMQSTIYLIKSGYVGMGSLFSYCEVVYNNEYYSVNKNLATASVALPFNVDLSKCTFDMKLKQEFANDYHFDMPYVEGNKLVLKVWGNDETKNNYVFYIDIYKCGEYNSVTDLNVEIVSVIEQSSKTYNQGEVTLNVKRGDLVRFAPKNEIATLVVENFNEALLDSTLGLVFKAEGFTNTTATLYIKSSDGLKTKNYTINIIVTEPENIISITSANEIKRFNGTDFNNDMLLFDGEKFVAFFNANYAEYNNENHTVKLNFNFASNVSITCGDVTVEQGINYLIYKTEQLTDASVPVNYVELTVVMNGKTYTLLVRFDNPTKICDVTVGQNKKTLIAYNYGYVGGSFVLVPNGNIILSIYDQSQIVVDETGDAPVYKATISITNLAEGLMVINANGERIENINEIELVLEKQDGTAFEMYASALVITDGENVYQMAFYFSNILNAMGFMVFLIV